MLVGWRDARAGIDNEQHQIALTYGGLGGGAHAAIEAFRIAFFEASGVDQPHLAAAQHRFAFLAVTRHTWGIRYNGLAPSNQLVEQR